nr:hypothetical protein BaRGS_000987 [Batillaria attramentaria]
MMEARSGEIGVLIKMEMMVLGVLWTGFMILLGVLLHVVNMNCIDCVRGAGPGSSVAFPCRPDPQTEAGEPLMAAACMATVCSACLSLGHACAELALHPVTAEIKDREQDKRFSIPKTGGGILFPQSILILKICKFPVVVFN